MLHKVSGNKDSVKTVSKRMHLPDALLAKARFTTNVTEVTKVGGVG